MSGWGGYDAVSAVVGEFAGRLFADEKLSSFFGGWSVEKQARFKQLNVLLVCNATGGPCTMWGGPWQRPIKGWGLTMPGSIRLRGTWLRHSTNSRSRKRKEMSCLGLSVDSVLRLLGSNKPHERRGAGRSRPLVVL